MIYSSMKSSFIHKCMTLIILAILGNIRLISSAALSPENMVSLYNASDKVTVLTSQNFLSTVYQSKTAWLVEFYASWCGHCRTYTNTYREVAIDAWAWQSIVRIGAINCYGEENSALCRQHSVSGYPIIRLIPPETMFGNTTKAINIPAIDAKGVGKELINGLDNMHKRYKLWPDFTPANRMTFEELYARIPSTVKLLLVIAEKREDLTARQVMLDFSKYHEQIAIFRTTTDGLLWRKFHLSLTDVPALFVILRNRSAERIEIKQNISDVGNRNLFNYAIQSYIQKTKLINNFDNHDLEEMINSKNILKKAEIQQKLLQNKNVSDDVADKNTVYRKVNMIDLELALSYMFRQEIPQMKEIRGEAYSALVHWLNILNKYFPGRKPVMSYFKRLLSKVNEQTNGFSGDAFREMIDTKTSNAYLPNDHKQYQHCAGSASQYRGYPCAVWLLFHTLTVAQYQTASKRINVTEVLIPIRNYIKYFFTCRQCSDHFMDETKNIKQLNLNNKHEAIIYLWTIHNHVNKRLHNDATEDPKHPKVQFPSKYLCTPCQSRNNTKHDVSNTVDFLLHYYAKENIDISGIIKQQNKDSSSEQVDLQYNNKITKQFGLTQYLSTILQRFPWYIFIGFIIIIVLCRRRYCKGKRMRYTI